MHSTSRLEVVAELQVPPGNVAVSREGRVFLTLHPEAEPETHLVEVREGELVPYPNKAWQDEREGPYWVTPLGVRVDQQNRLWVLDHGDYGSERPSLTAFDLSTNEVLLRYVFEKDVAPWGSMLNDLAVDAGRGYVYIADPSPYVFSPALVVFDVSKEKAWRTLEDHISVVAMDQHHVVQGRFMRAFGLPLQIGVDSIGITPDGTQLVYGPLSGNRLFLIATEALRNRALDPSQDVRILGPKPTSDGIVVGNDANVYLTAVEVDGLARLSPNPDEPTKPNLELLVQDEELLAWPDGLALSFDERWLYASVSELHRVIGQDLDALGTHAPYRVVRLRLGDDASEETPAPDSDASTPPEEETPQKEGEAAPAPDGE